MFLDGGKRVSNPRSGSRRRLTEGALQVFFPGRLRVLVGADVAGRAVCRAPAEAGVTGVWLQPGSVSDEAERLAAEAGIDFVQDRCMKVELMFQGG